MKPVPSPSDELEVRVAERTAELLRIQCGLEAEVARQRRTAEALRVSEEELRRTQEELESRIRERTAELDRFFTMSLDMLCIAGFDGVFKRLNPAWEKILGWSQEELQSRPYLDFIHPDDRERTIAEADRIVQGNQTLSFENRYRCKDGSCKWLVWTATPFASHQLIYAVARDITERKEAENRLAVQHATLAVLTEARDLPAAACLILPIICAGLGWDLGALWVPESSIGCLVLVELWHQPALDVPRFEAQTRQLSFPPSVGLLGRVWASGQPLWIPDVTRADNFVRADAAEREGLHSAIAFPIQLGSEVLGVLEFFSCDIRSPDEELLQMFAALGGQIGQFIERKRAEAALAERAHLAALGADVGLALTQEQQVPALLRRCAAALVRHLDAAFARVWVLNAAEGVLELQASAGIYTRTDGTFRRVPLTDARKLACIARDRQALFSNQLMEEPFVDKEWAHREGLVAFAGYPLLVEEQVLGVAALFSRQPLSRAALGALAALSHSLALAMKRIFAEEDMRRARESAEEANRAKSDFLAKMSHELRTPLNSVIGFANVLLKNKGKNLRETDLTFLERILDNGKHLLSLINHILDLSKVEAGKMELELTTVALDALVREVLDQIRGQVHGRSVRLVTDLPGTLAPLETDAGKLKQVLINLIGNALKFTAEGSVTVRVRADAADRPEAIEVSDTGIGIASDRLKAIFEAFQQADNSTARKFGGTGLGLTISRSLCQLLGYCLEVESTPGKGSTFRIRLSQTPVVSSGAAPPPAVELLLARSRVLVIDDEPDSRLLLSSYLIAEGAELRLVGDGREALALLDVFVPDLVLLDLMMPGVDGLAFLRQLRADPRFVELPVVVVTVKDLSAEEERELATQTLGIVRKGADLEGSLKRVLREALAGARAPSTTIRRYR